MNCQVTWNSTVCSFRSGARPYQGGVRRATCALAKRRLAPTLRTPGRGRAGRARRRAGRSRSRSRPGASTGSPSTHTADTVSPSRRVSETGRSSRERSQPASSSASARGPSTRSRPTEAIPGHMPASRTRHGRVRVKAMSETATRSNSPASRRVAGGGARPLGGVDDEPVAHLDDLVERVGPPGGLAPPAAERRQVGDQERQHDRAGVAPGRASQPDLDHLREHLAGEAVHLEVPHRHLRADGRPPARLGHEEDRAGRMALGQPGERSARLREPLRRCPDDVRHRARAQVRRAVGLFPCSQEGQLALDLGDDAHRRAPAQWRRQERPSRWISSSAAAGPQEPLP